MHRGKITIGAAFQVESQARHLARAILLFAELCGVVCHDSCTYAQRRVACGQPPSNARGIVDESTERDGRLTTEVIVEATSPSGCHIARDRAVGHGQLASIVKEATAMPSRIATEERVVDGHLAASADEQAATAFVGFPISERQSFEGHAHPIDQEHPHCVTTIQDHTYPVPIQGELPRGLAFPLDGERAGEFDRPGTREGDRVPIGGTRDGVLKLAIIAAIGDGKSGYGMLPPFVFGYSSSSHIG
jgi:hypothetical protein